jgi:hypothetical protein
MASDAELVRNLEKGSAGIKDATKNMASRTVQDAVMVVTEAIRAIVPRFDELAFGPRDEEPVVTTEQPKAEAPPPAGSSKVYLEDDVKMNISSISESLKEIATLMRKDKEDRARGSVPGSGR